MDGAAGGAAQPGQAHAVRRKAAAGAGALHRGRRAGRVRADRIRRDGLSRARRSAESPMSSDDPQFQYFDGQMRAGFAELLVQYEARSAAVEPWGTLDLRYGPHERQRFDFFSASGEPPGPPLGTLLYFHAGYWQSRDKATFRFIAPAFTRRGYNVALVNYPLCPSVTLAELVDAARASVPCVLDHLAALGQAPGALIAAGHSAGAHLAVELALTHWPELGARAQAVDGVIALSGLYDLAPLVATSINDKLGLDARTAQAQSPLYRVAAGAAPALFVVGGSETVAFNEQARRMAAAWQAAGAASALAVGPETDHYSLLQQWISLDGPLGAQVEQLLGGAREHYARRN